MHLNAISAVLAISLWRGFVSLPIAVEDTLGLTQQQAHSLLPLAIARITFISLHLEPALGVITHV